MRRGRYVGDEVTAAILAGVAALCAVVALAFAAAIFIPTGA